MKLNGAVAEQLRNALLDAFPATGDLEAMVRFKLNQNLERIVEPGDLSSKVAGLIKWGESGDRVHSLVIGALAARPSNRMLQDFAQQHLVGIGNTLPLDLPTPPPSQPTLVKAVVTAVLVTAVLVSATTWFVAYVVFNGPGPVVPVGEAITVEDWDVTFGPTSRLVNELMTENQRCLLKITSSNDRGFCGGKIRLWAARTCVMKVFTIRLVDGVEANAIHEFRASGPSPLMIDLPVCREGDRVWLLVGIFAPESTELETEAAEWKDLIAIWREPN